MIDPGALGTLIIGLRAAEIELKFDDDRPRLQDTSVRQPGRLRASFATALRTLADRLEPGAMETEAGGGIAARG
jgi:hypothetical protein